MATAQQHQVNMSMQMQHSNNSNSSSNSSQNSRDSHDPHQPARIGGITIGRLNGDDQLHTGVEVVKKREIRLLKNREAARECRRKKKEYIKCLENRVSVLEKQNKALIEELKSLKELYCKTSI